MNGCSAPFSSLHWTRHMVPSVPAQLWQRAEAALHSPHTHLLSSPSPVGSLWNGVSLKSSGDRYWLFSAEPSTHTQPSPAWPASWAQLSPTRAGLDKLLEHKLLIFIKPRVFVRLPYNNNTFVLSFRNPSKKDCKDELAILSMFNVKRYCMHYLILSTWS